jgi:hypothetical protein
MPVSTTQFGDLGVKGAERIESRFGKFGCEAGSDQEAADKCDSGGFVGDDLGRPAQAPSIRQPHLAVWVGQ